MADVARGSVLLTPKFDGLMSSINSQLSSAFGGISTAAGKAGSSASKAMGAGFLKTGSIIGVASSVTQRAFDAIANSMGSAIARVDMMENFPKVMQNLGYSSQDAQKSISRMSEAIDGMPTSLDSITGMVQQLAPLTGGLDQATSIGIAFNNMLLAGGASAADVSRAMQQYSQILSKGKPDLQDWKTLQEVMPAQLSQIAKALLGPTANSKQLYSALKDGSITMDQFNAAMVELNDQGVDGFASFSEQAKSATQGIGTAVTNVQNRISKAVAKVVDAIGQSNIAGAINAFSSQFDRIADAGVWVVEHVKAAIPGVSGAIGSMAQLWQAGETPVESFRLVVSYAMQRAQDAVSSAAGAIGSAIGELTARFPQIEPAVQVVSDAIDRLGGIGPAIQEAVGAAAGLSVFSRVVGPIGSMAGALSSLPAAFGAVMSALVPFRLALAIGGPVAVLQGGLSAIGGALAGLVSPVAVVVAAIAGLVAGFVYFYTTSETFRDSINGIITQLAATLGPVIQQVAATVMACIATVMPAVMQIAAAVAPVIQQILVILAQLAAIVVQVMAQILATVLPVITGIISAVMPVISTIVSVLSPAIQAILAVVQAVLPVVGALFNSVFSVISSVVTTVMGVIGAIVGAVMGTINAVISGDLGSIKGIWSGAWETMKGLLGSAWEGIKSGVSNGIGAVMDFIGDIPGKIIGFFGDAGSWLINAGASIIHGLVSGIQNAIGSAVNAVGDAVGKIRDLFPFSPAKAGPFSGHGYTTWSGKALITDFGKSAAKFAPAAARMVSGALSSVRDAVAVPDMQFSSAMEYQANARSVRAMAPVEGAAASRPSITQIFNQPVESPDEFARTMRMQDRYGIAACY